MRPPLTRAAVAAEASAYDGDLSDLGAFGAPPDDAGCHRGPGLDRH